MIVPDAQPAIPQRTRSRVRLVLAWSIILSIVVLTVRASQSAGALGEQQQLLFAEQARMFAMLALQMRAFQTDTAGSDLVHERVDQLIRQLEKSARIPEDKLRLAILAGENIGPDAALKRLDQLEERNNSAEIALDIETIRRVYVDGPAAVESPLAERLNRRYGYLGRLAFAYGIPAGEEPRKGLINQASSFVLRAGFIAMCFLGVVVLSLGLFVAGCVWFFKGKIQAAGVPDTSSAQVFLEAFALYLVLFEACALLIRLLGGVSIQWTWTALLILPLVWKWITARVSALEFRHAVGWHRGQGFIREFGLGVGGYLASLPFIAVGCFVSYVLIRYTGTQAVSPVIQELRGNWLALVGTYGLACVFAPFVEETMFRGIFLHHLRQRWSWIASASVVSIIFAMLHPQGWVAVPALASIAIVLAALREWRGSLIAPVAAHACNNFLALTFALMLFR